MNAIAETRSPLPAARATARPSFAGAVGGELLKLRRQAWIWVMLALAVALFAMLSTALLQAGNMKDALARSPSVFLSDLYDVYQAIFDTGAGIFLLIVSARLVGMEYGSGTIRVLLGRGAGRLRLHLAKLTALLLLGVVLLAGFLLLASVATYVAVVSWEGSAKALTSVPAHYWTDLGIGAGIGLAAVVAAIMIGSTAAVLGRSLAFGLAVALAFYPADNLLTYVCLLFNQVTHQHWFLDVTSYLLGPTLTALAVVLEKDRGAHATFLTPLIQVDATHAWLVVGVWLAAMLIVSAVLIERRDVLE